MTQCIVSLDKVDRFFWNDLMYTFTSVLKEGRRRNPQFVRWVLPVRALSVCVCMLIIRASRAMMMSISHLMNYIDVLVRRILSCTIWKEYHGEYGTVSPLNIQTNHVCLETERSLILRSIHIVGLRSLRTRSKWSKLVIKSWHHSPRLSTAYL